MPARIICEPMALTFYGIRHHGPGCARSLSTALEAQKPDIILLESPAELQALLQDAPLEDMEPPIAALIYQQDNPEIAAFYPFARFSPEWQVIGWAQRTQTPMVCFDLPAAHGFATQHLEANPQNLDEASEEIQTTEPSPDSLPEPSSLALPPPEMMARDDPLGWFARADGYSDGERWWNDRVEERGNSQDLFAAILEALTALRWELALPESQQTLRREAWMRRCLRQVETDGFKNIAVVSGAWHTPALVQRPKASEDNAILKGLPRVKVAATWVPWTLARLTTRSGYGAGIRSPGWYDHLWQQKPHPTVSWLTHAARILRHNDLEGSPASIIEAVRLADSLAGLRGRPRPGFDEMLEAMQTVFCQGDATALRLLEDSLFVGNKIGKLPEGVSNVPLQRDIEATQKRLRLQPAALEKQLTLDLREDHGRRRSAFLHRLRVLDIDWGAKISARSRGTFKEVWKLQWRPELVLKIIDNARYGNTLETAATAKLLHREEDQELASLHTLTEYLDLALLAQLQVAAERLLDWLDQTAATAHDTLDLLAAIPALVRIARYGDVRATDTTAVERILLHLTARAHIELPGTASGINDEFAHDLGESLRSYSAAMATLDNPEISADFHHALDILAQSETSHAEPCGLAVRLLHDAGQLDSGEVARRLGFALSNGAQPSAGAAWLEGFLSGSGSLLIHDRSLLALIDQWVSSLNDQTFQATLPLIRRTFGTFSAPERSQIGGLVAQGDLHAPSTTFRRETLVINVDRARPAVALVAQLLDLPAPDDP